MSGGLEFDPTVDYYKALGVTPKASADEIKKAYRRLAKQSHPDTTGGDKRKEARFKEVSAAYDVLGDSKRRAAYDEVRTFGGGGGGPRVRTGGNGFQNANGFGGANPVWDLGDLFGQMFQGGPGGPGGPRRSVRFEHGDDDVVPPPPLESKIKASDGTWLAVRGNDVHSDLRVTFDQAILGTTATVATSSGATAVKIPPGTASGRKLRLRGKGVVIDTRGPGDHYVTIQIDVPADLDEEGKQLVQQLAAHVAKKRK